MYLKVKVPNGSQRALLEHSSWNWPTTGHGAASREKRSIIQYELTACSIGHTCPLDAGSVAAPNPSCQSSGKDSTHIRSSHVGNHPSVDMVGQVSDKEPHRHPVSKKDPIGIGAVATSSSYFVPYEMRTSSDSGGKSPPTT